MQCIVCSNEMTAADHEGVPIDECPEGHGVWLDRGELRTVVERELAARSQTERAAELAAAEAGGAIATATQEVGRACPVCGHAMQKLVYAEFSNVVMDSCAQHGVWLDSGELERIEAYAEGFRQQHMAASAAATSGGGVPLPAPSSGLSGVALWESLQARN